MALLCVLHLRDPLVLRYLKAFDSRRTKFCEEREI